jgi:internalin A
MNEPTQQFRKRLANELGIERKGPIMKPFLALVFPLVLLLCGCGPAATWPTPQTVDAIAAIKELSGKVSLDHHAVEVISVDLRGTQITDAGLEHLKGLTSLKSLYLNGTQITDAGLEHLKVLNSLTQLNLGRTKITDAGLEHLKVLNSLTQLGLDDTQITGAGLEHLNVLNSLKLLQLNRTYITNAGLSELESALPKCKVIAVTRKTLPTSLQVAIAKIKKLGGRVSFDRQSSEAHGIQTGQVIDVGFIGTQVTDAELEHLKVLTSLYYLHLDGTQVTDAGLEHLKGLTSLKTLYLSGTQVTDAGVSELKAALPKCRVVKK